ncbi:MAG: hypothetical protein WCF67_07960 [Chitinophagaceae bacterium]
MKRILYCFSNLLLCYSAFAQNVGVGESSPGAKLTIRSSDAFSKSLLVKTTSNDTSFFIYGYNHFINGYTNTSTSSLTVNNKHFLPFDNAQLTILASGERSGINANGSLSTLDFRNINTTSRYNFSGYLGNAIPHNMGLYYYNPDASISKTLLYFTQDGYTGVGTFAPVGRLQINHTSASANPTLNLYDSVATGGPILQFRNAGGAKNWQIQGYLNHSSPNSDELNFVNNNVTLATLSNSGNFGIGTTAPQNKLHLHNTTGLTTSYTQFTNPNTGSGGSDGLLVGINGVGHSFIYNQENSRLYFGTANTTRMSISETGNVGIGIDPGTEKLDVVGNINASGIVRAGEVHRTSTGVANLVPIAYGNISSTGFIQSGSGNYTLLKISTGFYQVTITGEAYQFQTYTTVVTPAGNIGPIFTNTGSGGGSLHIYTYNLAGVAADSQFCFVVYKQ